jgi:predicted metal-dependent enzyme (double-stranded beta helix superfamily)
MLAPARLPMGVEKLVEAIANRKAPCQNWRGDEAHRPRVLTPWVSAQSEEGCPDRVSSTESAPRSAEVTSVVFDLERLISDCETALVETHPHLAVREILDRVLIHPARVADRMRPERGGITLLHHTPELTVIDVVWAPGMALYPHDHRMWAVIGVYTGREDNTFFRRDGSTLTPSNGRVLEAGTVTVLGSSTIHSVANPLSTLTGAIHVYGGDFVNQHRSQWRPPQLAEEPYDSEAVNDVFEAANAKMATP